MFERRPILGILIALTLCISIWRISVQEPSLYTTELGYANQLPFEDHHPLPTAAELHQKHRRLYRINSGRRLSNGRTTPQNLDNENLLPSNNLSLISFTPSTDPQSLSPYEYESFPANDFTTLIDFKDFKFLINQPFCPRRSSPYFLILVHSAPTNWEKRQVVRNTWGSVRSKHIHLLFLVGSVSKDTIQQRLERENSEFSDLVQGNFVDDYKNMTYKHVMAMKWFIYFCPEAKYLIKTDDDVFVNTLQLLEYVDLKQQQQQEQQPPPPPSSAIPRPYHVPKSNSDTCSSDTSDLCRNASHIVVTLQPKNFLFCQKEDQSRVKRSFRSKWRVSGREYANRYYPPYCPGFSIMYSPDVVFRLYKEAQNTKYFWIDDVHITGTLTQLSNITITSFCPWRLHSNIYESFKRSKADIGQFAFLFAWENTTEEQIRDLWAMILLHYNSTRPSSIGAALPYKYDSFR